MFRAMQDDPRATGWPGSWSKGQSRFDRGLAPLSPLKMTGPGRGGERRLCRRRTVQVWHVRCAHWGRRRFALRRAGRTRRCHNDVLLGLVDVQTGSRRLAALVRCTSSVDSRQAAMAEANPAIASSLRFNLPRSHDVDSSTGFFIQSLWSLDGFMLLPPGISWLHPVFRSHRANL